MQKCVSCVRSPRSGVTECLARKRERKDKLWGPNIFRCGGDLPSGGSEGKKGIHQSCFQL